MHVVRLLLLRSRSPLHLCFSGQRRPVVWFSGSRKQQALPLSFLVGSHLEQSPNPPNLESVLDQKFPLFSFAVNSLPGIPHQRHDDTLYNNQEVKAVSIHCPLLE